MGSSSVSSFPHRVWLAIFAMAGALLCFYLALAQLRWIPAPWDPLFGSFNTRKVLSVSLFGRLPAPEGVFGGLAFLIQAQLLVLGGSERYRTARWIVYLNFFVASLLALAGVFVLGYQLFSVRAFSTLCLTFSALSFALLTPAFAEARAAWRSRRARKTERSAEQRAA